MSGWEQFCREFLDKANITQESAKQFALAGFDKYQVYPDSIHVVEECWIFMAIHKEKKVLIVYGESTVSSMFSPIETISLGRIVKVCDLNYDNVQVIRKLFSFTNPVNHRGIDITIGLGDRLGIASPGHIRLLKGYPVFPVLAQQSMRELTLTGRDYKGVLTDVSWAVFQEGYTSGFGADGDHLKNVEDIKTALECGYTMITLDCSEHINNSGADMPAYELARSYKRIPETEREYIEAKYLGKEHILKSGMKIKFFDEELQRISVIYFNAVKFAVDVYNNIIQKCGRNIDFEVSIDEIFVPTSLEAHYFVAEEIISKGIKVTSLAPRFPGEFQKGIDYRGNMDIFTNEFRKHAELSEHFGYKLSIHSGSDKFSVFPVIGSESRGRYHLKTSGTNWLEAVRLIAIKDPLLYREIHKTAVKYFSEAKKFYHVTAELENVPDIDSLKDSALPELMDMEDSRQVLHITYGYVLNEKNPDGTLKYRNRIYSTLNKCERDFYEVLCKHIGRHISSLGL